MASNKTLRSESISPRAENRHRMGRRIQFSKNRGPTKKRLPKFRRFPRSPGKAVVYCGEKPNPNRRGGQLSSDSFEEKQLSGSSRVTDIGCQILSFVAQNADGASGKNWHDPVLLCSTRRESRDNTGSSRGEGWTRPAAWGAAGGFGNLPCSDEGTGKNGDVDPRPSTITGRAFWKIDKKRSNSESNLFVSSRGTDTLGRGLCVENPRVFRSSANIPENLKVAKSAKRAGRLGEPATVFFPQNRDAPSGKAWGEVKIRDVGKCGVS